MLVSHGSDLLAFSPPPPPFSPPPLTPPPPPPPAPGSDVCVYDSKYHVQGDIWTSLADCSLECTCDDAATGHYTCANRLEFFFCYRLAEMFQIVLSKLELVISNLVPAKMACNRIMLEVYFINSLE